MRVSRRDALKLLGTAGTLATVGGVGLAQQTAPAAAATPNGSGFNRVKIGDFTVTVVSDGQNAPAPLLPNWGANPDKQQEFQKTLRDNFIDPTAARNNFLPVIVDTGRNKVLIDTGFGVNPQAPTGKLLEHMRLAGYTPDSIDTVFLTHQHGDHIQGLTDAQSQPVFKNARLVIGETEYNAATKPASGQVNAAVTKNLVSQASRFTFLKTGAEIVSGVTTVDSPGHTPGHQSVLISSGTAQMMVFGDAAGHFILSLQYPDAYLGFDADKSLVLATRAKLFDRVASERMLVTGYHFPFPGVGYIRKRTAGGYEFVPAPFQF